MFHDILQSQIGLGCYSDVATYGVVAVVTVLMGMFYLNPSRTFYPLPFSHTFPLSLLSSFPTALLQNSVH